MEQLIWLKWNMNTALNCQKGAVVVDVAVVVMVAVETVAVIAVAEVVVVAHLVATAVEAHMAAAAEVLTAVAVETLTVVAVETLTVVVIAVEVVVENVVHFQTIDLLIQTDLLSVTTDLLTTTTDHLLMIDQLEINLQETDHLVATDPLAIDHLTVTEHLAIDLHLIEAIDLHHLVTDLHSTATDLVATVHLATGLMETQTEVVDHSVATGQREATALLITIAIATLLHALMGLKTAIVVLKVRLDKKRKLVRAVLSETAAIVNVVLVQHLTVIAAATTIVKLVDLIQVNLLRLLALIVAKVTIEARAGKSQLVRAILAEIHLLNLAETQLDTKTNTNLIFNK